MESASGKRKAEAGTAEESDLKIVQHMVDPETWNELVRLELEKEGLAEKMDAWKKKFWNDATDVEKIDSKKFEKTPESRVLHKLADGSFAFYLPDSNTPTRLTQGQVFAAAEWGIWWRFERSVPPDDQIAITSHQVGAIVANKYEKQLIAFGKNDRLSNDGIRSAYDDIEKNRISLESMPNGILTERMLFSFLTKEMHDGDLPFKVESVDLYEDVEHKIDFIITYEGKSHGVDVKEPRHRIGIQFTLDPNATDRKTQQLNRVRKSIGDTDVDDIIFVTMPLDDVREIFNSWRYTKDKTGKVVPIAPRQLDPRGPDHFWPPETKKAIIDGLVRRVGISRP